jgi:pimeloyl-ACP methyl ester carboxylesterase
MTGARTTTIQLDGEASTVLEKGSGEPVVYLAGLRGLPRWLPFLDRLADTRRVVVLNLPGFPGGAPTVFRTLDDHLDWLAATLDLFDAAGLRGVDVVASSVGGMLAADVAALSPGYVRRLVLIAPFGLYDTEDPGPDYFAELEDRQPALLVADPHKLAEVTAPPDGVDPLDTKIDAMRALEAAARLTWPFGDRHIKRRLHRVTQPTLVVWGDQDRILPPSYAQRWASGIGARAEVVLVPGAGHECVIDEPEVSAKHVLSFLDGGDR